MEAVHIFDDLHKITDGCQNALMNSQLGACPTYSDVYFSIHDGINKFKRTIKFDKYDSPNMGLANITVEPKDHTKRWSYTLKYGDSHYDYIDSSLPYKQPWMCREGRAIPFIKYHTVIIEFDVEGDQELEISYDIVKVSDKSLDDMNSVTIYEYGIIRNSLVSKAYVNKDHLAVSFNLNHPTYSINIKTDKMVQDIFLYVAGHCISNFAYDVVNEVWSLDFHTLASGGAWSPEDRTVNLSRLDGEFRVKLVNPDDEVKLEYSNIYWNCVRRASGMTGMAYAAS